MAREFRLPDIGEGLTDAEIVSWHVAVGDAVAADQPLLEVETAKAVVEITSPYAGTVLHLGGEEGDSIQVGSILVVIGDPGESWASTPEVVSTGGGPVPTPAAAPAPGAQVRAMPLVRRLAAELGVDLGAVIGSGAGGSITRADVEAAAAAHDGGQAVRVPLSRMRKTIAEHMTRSWREIPHVTVQADIDASALLATRSRLTEGGNDAPLEALVARCVIPALREFPQLNASLDGDDLVLHDHLHLGFAVDTEDGLIVVVVRDAGELTVSDLGTRIADLAARARGRSVTPDEVTGQTFTISNIGALGGGHGTPIIPFGTIGILSFGRATDSAVVVDGAVSVAPVIPLDLSYDHRVVDGGLGQRFLARLVSELESAAALG
jgi:pyruvate dehydrogenase E2 component (dihydrolipoamide acetyltransferase)